MVDAGLDVGGVEVDVGEGDVVEAPGAEHGDLFVDPGADPRHRRLRHPRFTAQRPDQVVDLPRRGAGRVGGHDHAPQGLVDPPARLQQRREERPDPHLRDPQLDIARRRRQQPAAAAVALVRPGIGALVRAAPITAVNSASISSCMPASSSRRNSSFLSPSPSRASRSATRASSSWVIAWVPSSECFRRSHQGSRDGPPITGTVSLLPPPHGTPTGARTLTIPQPLAEVLAVHFLALGVTAADKDALLFPDSKGGLLRSPNFPRGVWYPAAVKAGVGAFDADGKYRGPSFHDLRRTSATGLVVAGVDVKTAQSRLGHSRVSLTLELYAQAVTEADRLASDALASTLIIGSRHGSAMARRAGGSTASA